MSPASVSTNSEPSSTTLTCGQSTHSSATSRWRLIRNYIFPHFHEAEVGTALLRRHFRDDLSDASGLYLMSGGLPEDKSSHNNLRDMPCRTGLSNRPIKRDFAFLDKPLPNPPPTDAIGNELEDNQTRRLPRSHIPSMILEEGETAEDARNALMPPPLDIGRKCTQKTLLRTRSLSPLMVHGERPHRVDTEQSQPSPPTEKRYGSVRNARLAAEARLATGANRVGPKHGHIRSTTSTPCLRSQSQLPWQSILASITDEKCFVNPRKAPSPPYKKAKHKQREAIHERSVRPRNVARARAAVVEALNTRKLGNSPRSSRSS